MGFLQIKKVFFERVPNEDLGLSDMTGWWFSDRQGRYSIMMW